MVKNKDESIVIKNEDYADLQKQHEFVDTLRSTNGIDYEKVQNEAQKLLQLRLTLQKQNRLSEYDTIGSKLYPNFAVRFPHFFKSIKTVESDRIEEAVSVMMTMFQNLVKVQNGELSHTAMREQFFEQDLASRYMKQK